MNRTITRLLAAPAAAGVVVLAVATPASAHVTITPDTTAAGAYAVLTAALSHGCEGSPTTRITISMPEDIYSVAPARTPFWDVEVETEKLDEPIADAHGNSVTERDTAVVFTAKQPLADGVRDSFDLSVKLPDAEGETLVFPAIQTCEKGETAWTEVAADGTSADELETPAPTFTLTAAEGDGPVSYTHLTLPTKRIV